MNKLETKVGIEFSKLTIVWEAFRYAKDHDLSPGWREHGRYYVPSTVKEIKGYLKERYSESKGEINGMTSKQARMVYHTIRKFLAA